jgi:hypothetical protein
MFGEVAIGPDDFANLAVYEYLREADNWTRETGPLVGLWLIAKNAGWIVPHEHVCWVSDRPDVVLSDSRGRLHCASGPALRYRDGWSVYAWKGLEVPAWMVEHPERITPARIDEIFEPFLRNTAIDIMTPERFIGTGEPRPISKDDTGVLWRKTWRWREAVIGTWSAVEVENGTTGSDGSRKKYFLCVPSHLRTAREAVAWTYGLSAKQYGKLALRT